MLLGSNVETGKAEYIHLKDMRKSIHYLRASASLPYLSRIVEIEGKKYLDGGCTDSVPVKAFREMGYEKMLSFSQDRMDMSNLRRKSSFRNFSIENILPLQTH